MTNQSRRFDTTMLNDPLLLGFDRIFDRMGTLNAIQQKQTNYPPYNIIKTDDDQYYIEIAVAGFQKDEIDITVEDGVLTVTGTKDIVNSEKVSYVHKGIAERNFERKFTLSDTVVVQGADIVNGVLSIELENIIPEEKKPRKIAIGNSEAQLLTEE